jgi:hypothetical protein
VDARVIDRVLSEVAETRVDHWLHGLSEHRESHLGDQYDRHDQDVNRKMDDRKMDDRMMDDRMKDDRMKIYLVFQIFSLRSSFLHSSLHSRSLQADINITV